MKHHLCPPELKLASIHFGLAICLCGCSSSYEVRSTAVQGSYTYGEMNEELKGEHVNIELKDGKDVYAREVKISDDSVSWVDQRTDKESKASIRQLYKIVMKNHFLGALEGLGFGLVGGGIVGGGGGMLLAGDGEAGNTGASYRIIGLIIGGVLGGGTGLITGGIYGGITGHGYNYKFPMSEQSDSLQNRK